MVEELYSDRIVEMEIMMMMTTRREHVGLENNGGDMFWRAMEGLLERGQRARERVKRKVKRKKEIIKICSGERVG